MAKPDLPVTVFSDYICPFCYIRERRLARLSEHYDLSVDWRFLEIHPGNAARRDAGNGTGDHGGPHLSHREADPGGRRPRGDAACRGPGGPSIQPLTGPLDGGPFGYPASLAAMEAACFPWKRAAASSFPLGIRSPLAPAMVDAP